MQSVSLSDILARGRNNFDLVRLLAAAAVVVGHSFIIVTGDLDAEPLTGTSAFTLGQHAVNVFFFLSGLLVSASLERNADPAAFMTSRALRVFPGLVVCVLLLDLVMGPMVSSLDLVSYFTSWQTWNYLVATLSLSTGHATLPGVFDTLPAAGLIDVSLWTLKYEVICYLLLCALSALGLWQRAGLMWAALATLVAAQLMRLWSLPVDQFGVLDQMLRFLICFFIGAAAYRLRRRVKLSPSGAAAAVLALAAAWGTILEPLAAYVAAGYLVLCLSALPLGGLRRLCARADLSYGIYIYGWPVGQLLLSAMPWLSPVELAAASVLATAPVAFLSWALVEKPSLAMKRRPSAGVAVLPLTEEAHGNYCPRP